MRVPQVSERIKEAPAQALRGVFAGIGQLLLITDRLRNKAPAGQDVPRARMPETVADVTATTPAKKTSPAAAAPAAAKTAAVASAPARPTPAKPAATEPVVSRPPKPQSVRDLDKTGNVRLLGEQDGGSALDARAPDVAPPLPNYGELTLPSLRARLRNLDVAQVRQLADYERAHAARADVLTMYERRIAKLEAGSQGGRLACRSTHRPILPSPSARCCNWSAGGSAVSAGSGSRGRSPSSPCAAVRFT